MTQLMTRIQGYHRRQLDPNGRIKPLDFAAGTFTGSVNASGRIVALNTYDAIHGIITLSSAPPFPEADRYDSLKVRAYRARLATLSGFGITFPSPITERAAALIEDAIPYLRLTLDDGTLAECITFAHAEAGLFQLWAFDDKATLAQLSGQIWLQRAAYTQLTEGGPAAMPPVATHPLTDAVGVTNPALDWDVYFPVGSSFSTGADGSVQLSGEITSDADGLALFHLQYAQTGTPQPEHTPTDAQTLLTETLDQWRGRWQGFSPPDPTTAPALKRGLVYGMGCSIPVSDAATCILTDHMLLPLSWNRDAYYVARGLLNWHPDGAAIVKRHLTWLFDVAERENGMWGRSYLANGKIKDRGYQLDQQIFPFLELADYTNITGDDSLYLRWQDEISTMFFRLVERSTDDVTFLFPTDETPADDPITYPYHLSSHILLWHTTNQLNTIIERLEENPSDFPVAWMIRASIDKYFIIEHEGREIYAYATDGKGNYHLYHDANDIPLVYAPAWGFCSYADPVWQATVQFAFSADNLGGAVDGKLGSVHTPDAPWPLGDMQELVIAQMFNDKTREATVRERIAWAAQWDGALPEAYENASGDVRSRHWFAWPNAMLPFIDLQPPQQGKPS